MSVVRSGAGNVCTAMSDQDQVADAEKMPPPLRPVRSKTAAQNTSSLPVGPLAAAQGNASTSASVKTEQGEGDARIKLEGREDVVREMEEGQGDARKKDQETMVMAGGERPGDARVEGGEGHDGIMVVENEGQGDIRRDGTTYAARTLSDNMDAHHLEHQLCNTLHQFSLKRVFLDSSRQELMTTSLAVHELERALASERSEAQEVRQQYELATTASRRWEEERGSLMGAVSRQKVQLAAAQAERDILKDEARNLQFNSMKLRRQVEELEGQLRCTTTYQESNISACNRLRSMHETLNSEFQKLSNDHQRLQQTFNVVNKNAANALVNVKHYNCVKEKESGERKALESEVARLRMELEQLSVQCSPQNSAPEFSKEDEMSVLQEMVSDLQLRVEKGAKHGEKVTKLYSESVASLASVTKSEALLQTKLNTAQGRVAYLEATNTGILAENEKLRENLRCAEQSLLTERERSKKAECVERGVQCDVEQIINTLGDKQESDVHSEM